METKCLGHPENEFRKMGKRIIEPTGWETLCQTLAIVFPKIAKVLRIGLVPKEVQIFFMETVRTNLEYREKNNVERNDFFQLVMNIKKNDKDFKFVDLAAQSFVFFVGG
jgi:cytochrome P450 family 6